jgi:hypothetical protein
VVGAADNAMEASSIPSFHVTEGLGERPRLLQQLCKAVDEGSEPVLGHVGGQVVERGALAEQGMGAGLNGVGLEVAVHAEALASGTEPGEQDDGEGVEQQQPVAALRIGDPHRAKAQAETQVLGIPEAGLDTPSIIPLII